MKCLVVTLGALLLPFATIALTFQEDDLVFDDVVKDFSASRLNDVVEETTTRRPEPPPRRESEEKPKPRKKAFSRHFEKPKNAPSDVTAVTGHVFKLKIPKNFFEGSRQRYRVQEKRLPSWLYWDEPASTIVGVASKKDEGKHKLVFTLAKKLQRDQLVTKAFNVRVVSEKRAEEMNRKDGKSRCDKDDDKLMMMLFINETFDRIKPQEKTNALENLAGFYGLAQNSLTMQPCGKKECAGELDSSNLKSNKRHNDAHLTSIQWQIGCNNHTWKNSLEMVQHIDEQRRDGTLTEVTQLPCVGTRVRRLLSSSLSRNRREVGSGFEETPDNDRDTTYGSGDSGDYDEYEDGYEGEDDEGNEPPDVVSPVAKSSSSKVHPGPESEHPHRHHHGEGTIIQGEVFDEKEIVPKINGNYQSPDSNATKNSETTTTKTPEPEVLPGVASSSSSLPPPTPGDVGTTSAPSTLRADVVATTAHVVTTPESVATTAPYAEPVTDATEPLPVTSSAPPPYDTATSATSATLSPRSNATAEINPPVTDDNDDYDDDDDDDDERDGKLGPRTTGYAESTTNPPGEGEEDQEPTDNSTTGKEESRLATNAVFPETTTRTEMATTATSTSTTTSTTSTPIPSTTTSTTPMTTPIVTTTTTTTTPMTTPIATTTSTTTMTPSTSTAPSTTTTNVPIERVAFNPVITNNAPSQGKRLKKISVVAGKPLRYVIPADTFIDLEDGDTSNLRLSLYDKGNPIKKSHWLQFDSNNREVYGLPLEDDVSTWIYDLVAYDKENLNVSDTLEIHVHQHKLSRAVNHEFVLYLKIENKNEFRANVDWELRVIGALADLYQDTSDRITVRSVQTSDQQSIFTWTNDSVPRGSECPSNEIDALRNVLLDREKENRPNVLLQKYLNPEIKVERVMFQGIGQCEGRLMRPKPTAEVVRNEVPVTRNQVDFINVTVGQLLVFRVPEDTFFDKEDGSARNMKMSLYTANRGSISEHSWLQFDTKNQEFFGVPLQNDVGRQMYQLVVSDKHGATATDSLEVAVHAAPKFTPSVEFHMTLDIPYEDFARSAVQKRNLIERIRELYNDRDTSAISLTSINSGSTIVTWRNRTLPTSYCPDQQIRRLREVLVNDDKSVNERVNLVMGPQFPVSQVTVQPMGACVGEMTRVHSPDNYVPPPVDDSTSLGARHDEYLVTFVLPAIIIAAMMLLAGVIACILYKRRRSGKMSVSEHDDERQSFRSKGIPVIFQDELDEKPEPGNNKSPVIMKEEKPIAPPEYQKTEDGADEPMLRNSEEPYQPPPPFPSNRDSSRLNRHKPTYRQPPPYVPP